KPFDLPDLMKRAARALEQKRRVVTPKRDTNADRGDDLPLVGRTPAMQSLYRLVARVMNTELPVLITGESGTGKSLIAKAIHDFSDRRNLPFVVVTPDDLVPMEGPAKVLARAGQGTLLFDEVGDLDTDAQARITRMLDSLTDPAPRIISTSQGDLSRRLKAGEFRQDLYYRLGGVTIPVPALRERLEDIPALAEHFLARAERDGLTARVLNPEAAEVLRAYPWPGNVRQLENTIQRLMVTGSEAEISRGEVEATLGTSTGNPVVTMDDAENISAAVARHLRRYFDLHGGALPPPGVYQRVLREIEVPLIEIALDATGGNQARCADLLGINRNTLRKKITELGIEVTRRRKLM
ncbi:MAG: sigma-54-dependent Fis family transcriptional regulator, partial [Maritimibacter sp.]|nr:sigma-54-dependent Fis family transcriptional regulator [Maritimibacter sp.]